VVTLLAFVVAILILVSLHELGHYVVARWCGVKVLRFSVGFGKPFFTKKRGDTEWCLAPIPLGGYVKMVDTREGNVAEADLPFAFDKQAPLKKMAIVVAGPLTNLVLAVLLYFASFSFGVTDIKPWIGTVLPNSLAERSGFVVGDQIQSVNNEAVQDWGDSQTKLILGLGAGDATVAVVDASGHKQNRIVKVAGEDAALKAAAQGQGIGLWVGKTSLAIGEVVPDSPAALAGFKEKDILVSANEQAIDSWAQWVTLVEKSAGVLLTVDVLRDGKTIQLKVRPDSKEVNGQLIGKIGLAPSSDKVWEEKVRTVRQPSLGEAFILGANKTWEYATLTIKFFGKLIMGQASLNNISGPVTIAEVAGKTAKIGLQSYIEFLALVSISLGVLNLLPIPVLDGGHLLYYAIEWVRGKPLSERIQAAGLRFGLAVMLLFMLVAMFNDISRVFG
jgi:regulator of sigma E protease